MTKFTSLLLAGFIMPFFLCAQEIFENEYFKISLPESMKKSELSAAIVDNRENIHKYSSGTNSFIVRKMESTLTAAAYISDLEKATKKMGDPVQSQRFNVNGTILPGLVTVEKASGSSYVHVYIMFDNGRHKLAEAGNACLFQFEMSYLLEDEMKQQPKNEKALQSFTMKKETFDFYMTKDFSLTAPALSFVYYSSIPFMMLPSNPLVQISFGGISTSLGVMPNPAFADILKKEFKEFKELYSKATVTEMTIDGYKAALMKGKYENKEYKSCDWHYQYLIEVSPKLVRVLKYNLVCEYSDIQQPVIDEIVKTFRENKK